MIITIEPYTDDFKEAVIAHILNIQQNEFKVPITAADQPDLQIISEFYQVNGGNFWIATCEGALVGTIALLPFGNKNGCIRKMFVHKDFRGREYSIAQNLLNTLIAWAKGLEINGLYLGTNDRLHAAIRFYEKNEFAWVDKTNLPENFPFMQVDTNFYGLVFS
jgi:N-acetylglutamate synthase-like GNAT family acetyltransferase